MLLGVNPLLTGTLLSALDGMGHSDALVVCDAHFPVHRLGRSVVELPGVPAPAVVEAICSVLPLDDDSSPVVMGSPEEGLLEVQVDLLRACGAIDRFEAIGRQAFYDAAEDAVVHIRTGERRPFGNLMMRKGLVATEAILTYERPHG